MLRQDTLTVLQVQHILRNKTGGLRGHVARAYVRIWTRRGVPLRGVQLKSEKNLFLLPEGVFIIKLADLIYIFRIIVVRRYVKCPIIPL